MSIIEVKNLIKYYGQKEVFKNFNINVKRGEFIGITGKSGCGKSTLLNIIGLLEEFDEGTVTIMGEENININSSKATDMLRHKIGYVFQNGALIDDEDIYNNMKIALKYVKESKSEKRNSIHKALEIVGLCEMLDKKIYQLSGGEQQRVAIARVLIKPCDIVLIDEPTGSLDNVTGKRILELLKKINEQGKTIIMVSHDNNAMQICDRVINIDEIKKSDSLV